MKFLGANDKIEMWDFFQQLRPPRLRHAAEKAKDGFRPALRHAAEHSHLAKRLLLGHVAHAAGIEENDIGLRLATDPLVAAGNERMRNLLRVALVHLAAVGLNEEFRHGSRTIHRGGGWATPLGGSGEPFRKWVPFQTTAPFFVGPGVGAHFVEQGEPQTRFPPISCRGPDDPAERW